MCRRINNPVLQERKGKLEVLQLVHVGARREARKSSDSLCTSQRHRHCAVLEMGMFKSSSAVPKSKTKAEVSSLASESNLQ